MSRARARPRRQPGQRLAGALGLLCVAVLSLGVACNGGLDPEDANATCEADRALLPNCYDDEAFDQCVACHIECGTDCATLTTVCPTRYTCPEDG